MWKQHKSKWSETANQCHEQRGERSPHPPAQPSLGNTSAIPRERRQRTDSFSTQAGSCSDDKLLLLLPEIATPLPLPGIRPRKTCSRGNSPQAFLLTWLGREEGDLFVGEIRNKVSGGCDLWQRWEEKNVETASLPKPSCPGKQRSGGLIKSQELFLVVRACDPSTLEPEAGESRVGGQPGPQARSYKIR